MRRAPARCPMRLARFEHRPACARRASTGTRRSKCGQPDIGALLVQADWGTRGHRRRRPASARRGSVRGRSSRPGKITCTGFELSDLHPRDGVGPPGEDTGLNTRRFVVRSYRPHCLYLDDHHSEPRRRHRDRHQRRRRPRPYASRYLQPRQTMVTRIDGIGQIVTPVRADLPGTP